MLFVSASIDDFQEHYDWGLRAIKSVLVVAGTLRRADPDMSEDKVLMRALRDFNIPKITVEDMAIFLNLIADLFPAVDVERKRLEWLVVGEGRARRSCS